MNSKDQFLHYYDQSHERFARYCRALASGEEEAKDLMSESILRAFENFDGLKNRDAFPAFLVAIARRIYLNQLRRNKFKALFSPARAESIPDDQPRGDTSADVEILYQALDQLPQKQKESIILFEISGFSIKEIAEIQNSGLSAVKARLARGRKQLTLLLSDAETQRELQKKQSYETAII